MKALLPYIIKIFEIDLAESNNNKSLGGWKCFKKIVKILYILRKYIVLYHENLEGANPC